VFLIGEDIVVIERDGRPAHMIARQAAPPPDALINTEIQKRTRYAVSWTKWRRKEDAIGNVQWEADIRTSLPSRR
jgi:hypothetical protein